MEETCKNCLNAYNPTYTNYVVCTNKMWYYLHDTERSKVTPHETCDSWTQRKPTQNKLQFQKVTQLTINFEI